MANTLGEIRSKKSSLTVQDLKRLLFRCAATLISLQKVRVPDLSLFQGLPNTRNTTVRTRSPPLFGCATVRDLYPIRYHIRHRSLVLGDRRKT